MNPPSNNVGIGYVSANQLQQPQAQSSQQPNFLEGLLPTAGGILGGIGGELIDPFGGGIAGAALGSGLGKAAENATQGQNPFQGSDITAGIEGGIGQGLGAGLGGVLGLVGGKLANFGAEQGAKDLISKEFGNLTTKEAEALNLPNSLNVAKDMGIPTTTDAFSQAPSLATGNNTIEALGNKGILNNIVDSAVADAHPQGIDLTGYRGAAEDAINKRTVLGGLEPTTGGKGSLPRTTSQGDALMSNLERMMQQHGLGGTGNIGEGVQVTPGGAMKLLREMQGMQNVNGLSQAEKAVYEDMTNFLKSKIYTPEVDSLVAKTTISPEDANIIQQASKNMTGSEDYGNALINKVNSATKASDLTDTERRLIDMRDAGTTAGSRNAAKAILPSGGGGGEMLQHALTGNKTGLLGSIIKKAGGTSSTVAKTAGDLLQRLSPFTANAQSGILNKILPAVGATIGTSPNVSQAANSNAQIGGAMQPTSTNMQSGTGLPVSPVEQAFSTALRMVQVNPYLASSMMPVLESLAPQLQKIQGAAALAPTSLTGFQAAGGGQGLIPGTLANVGALLTGGPGATQGGQESQLSQQLSALGIPAPMGTFGPAQVQALRSLLGSGAILPSVPQQ